jgi:predicted ABC-class ATPase
VTLDDLRATLQRLDGTGYRAYKGVEGAYEGPGLRLVIDHVQGDPFADPSRVRFLVGPGDAGLPEWAWRSRDRRRATADFMNRALVAAAAARSGRQGSGRSGELVVLSPGQAVLDRTSVQVDGEGGVVARFRIGLPARGRRILGRAAAGLVTAAVEAVRTSLFFDALDPEALRRHVETVEDAVALRGQLAARGLLAFVADGALLPRRSGVDERPLARGGVPFTSPPTMRCTLVAPNRGSVSGMGVPRGVTLVVGGGYHGKSTLLRALERGVYDHVPGDGRERVVTIPTAMKVRAEDGRRVAGTDISNFIGALPDGADTTCFETDNASGSTSQAAAIVEALEAGAEALLLDEDTSATNFMIRDGRMQRLIAVADEPITPFIDRARALFSEAGVSTVLVVGGSGDYFDVADQVVAMRRYRPEEVTAAAREVAAALPSARQQEGGAWRPFRTRRPEPMSLDPRRGHRAVAIRTLSRDRVEYGLQRVDLSALAQLVETAQTRAVALAVARFREGPLDGRLTIGEAVAAVAEEVERGGPGVVAAEELGELASFRALELAAFINRVRSLRTRSGARGDAPES